jgi:hypothetical protein
MNEHQLLPNDLIKIKAIRIKNCKTSNILRGSAQYTGCLKKDATEIQQAVVHHKRG